MITKSFYFSLIFIALSPFYCVHSLTLDDAISIIQEAKKSFEIADKTIETVAQFNAQEHNDYFSQENIPDSEKDTFLCLLFNFCNEIGAQVITNYQIKSNRLKKSLHRLPSEHQRVFLAIMNAQQPSLKIETPVSQPLSVYIEQIKENFKADSKIILQNTFNFLRQFYSELDPQILSD